MEKLIKSLCLCLLLVLPAAGADITAGHTFHDGDRVTSSDLNSVVGSATIGTSFYTSKSSVSVAQPAHVVLVYAPEYGGYRQITISNLLYSNLDLPLNLSNTSNTWIYAWTWLPPLTNLTAVTTPHPGDFLSIWDTNSASWKTISYTNAVSAPVAIVSNLVLAATNHILTNYVSPLVPLTVTYATNFTHGLPGTPQQTRWTLRCTSADQGYSAGDEVNASAVAQSGMDFAISCGANSTAVFWHLSGSTIYIMNKSTMLGTPLTPSKWSALCYATYFY